MRLRIRPAHLGCQEELDELAEIAEMAPRKL